jgi:hypothetical protein
MASITYTPPAQLNVTTYFPAGRPSERMKSLLLLTGHGRLTRNGTPVKLHTDYLSIPIKTSGKFKLTDIAAKIPNCTNAEFKKLISTAATKNVRIHQNIYLELAHCLTQLEKKSYVASFVHLYRLIEHTALYLPLVSIVSKGVNDYTFIDYKAVIESRAKSDLSVLKKFSAKGLDANAAASKIIYSFSNTSNPSQNKNIAADLFDVGKIVTSGNDFIEIKLQDTDQFIVNFRNHFFHYIYHEKNISLKNLDDPDEFLSACMPSFLNYFAFLYRELLIAEWELWC